MKNFSGYWGDGGPATQAGITWPEGIAYDKDGNLYITDIANERIRKVTTDGNIHTIAGTGDMDFYGDNGPATEAALSDPVGVAVDYTGNVFIADRGNCLIRRVDAKTQTITTVAGDPSRLCTYQPSTGDGGLATSATMARPDGVALDAAGNLYIAEESARIRKVDAKTQISYELGVQYFLEGTIKQSGQDIRITALLVRADDQTQLWADTYDGQASAERILGFQQSVAARVAESLSLVLPEVRMTRSSTASQAAYEAFLKGRHEWNKRNDDGFQKAVAYFENAVLYDPKYAQAYVGLADSYNLSREYYEGRSTDNVADLGKAAALKALALDPALSEAHASLGFNLWRYEWKFQEAEAEFRRALDLSPNNATAHHWFGMFLASRGRFDEARRELRESQGLDPLSLIIATNRGWVDYYARNYDAAIASYKETLSLDDAFQTAQMKLAWAYEQKAMWQEALAARRRFYITAGHPEIAQALTDAYSSSGYPGVLRAIIAESTKPDAGPYYSDYERARLYAMIGDADRAFQFLDRARASRSGWLVYLAVEPAFTRLRTDPRFAKLLEQTVSARHS